MPIEGKRKTRKKRTCGLFTEHHSHERRNWIDIEPRKYSLSDHEVSRKVIHLLRHSQEREEDGAVYFWRIKENLQIQFPQSIHWSDGRWKACLAAGFFQHIYHIGCAFNFHSIINNGLILGGQDSSKRQTLIFF